MKHTREALTLTIVIPAYNEGKRLRACLESIAQQIEKPDQVIVVDNNSTDDTLEIAADYEFVTTLKEPRQGIFYARNLGFDAATSEIIGRIDADTILPPYWVEYVKKYYAVSGRSDTALTGSGYFYNVKFPPKFFWKFLYNIIVIRFNRFVIGHYILWGSNMAFTQKQWQAVVGEVCEDLQIHEDIDLAIHLYRHSVKINYRPKLEVRVEMKRVFDDWSKVYPALMMWPRTFKKHHYPRWYFGTIGAYFLLIISPLAIILNKPIFWLRKLFS